MDMKNWEPDDVIGLIVIITACIVIAHWMW